MQLSIQHRLAVPIVLACFVLLGYWGAPASPTLAQSQGARSQTATEAVYIVQRGDTLYSIASRFNVTSQQIVLANNITNVNLIRIGQELIIPGQPQPPVPGNPGNGTIPVPTVTSMPANTPVNGTIPPAPATATAYPTAYATAYATAYPTAYPTATPTTYQPPVAEAIWTEPDGLIEVFSPVAETSYRSPMDVVGFSRTFESTVSMRLVDEDGVILAERFTMGGGVDGYDFFHTYLRFVVTEPTTATLELFQTAGEGDELIIEAAVPVTLLPGQRAIDLLSPSVDATVCGDFAVAGYSFTFEGAVPVALTERDGTKIAVMPVIGGGVGYYDWSVAFDGLSIGEPSALLLSVYEESTRDGSQIDTTRIPLSAYPAGDVACRR